MKPTGKSKTSYENRGSLLSNNTVCFSSTNNISPRSSSEILLSKYLKEEKPVNSKTDSNVVNEKSQTTFLSQIPEKEAEKIYMKYFPKGTKVVHARCACGYLHPFVSVPCVEVENKTTENTESPSTKLSYVIRRSIENTEEKETKKIDGAQNKEQLNDNSLLDMEPTKEENDVLNQFIKQSDATSGPVLLKEFNKQIRSLRYQIESISHEKKLIEESAKEISEKAGQQVQEIEKLYSEKLKLKEQVYTLQKFIRNSACDGDLVNTLREVIKEKDNTIKRTETEKLVTSRRLEEKERKIQDLMEQFQYQIELLNQQIENMKKDKERLSVLLIEKEQYLVQLKEEAVKKAKSDIKQSFEEDLQQLSQEFKAQIQILNIEKDELENLVALQKERIEFQEKEVSRFVTEIKQYETLTRNTEEKLKYQENYITDLTRDKAETEFRLKTQSQEIEELQHKEMKLHEDCIKYKQQVLEAQHQIIVRQKTIENLESKLMFLNTSTESINKEKNNLMETIERLNQELLQTDLLYKTKIQQEEERLKTIIENKTKEHEEQLGTVTIGFKHKLTEMENQLSISNSEILMLREKQEEIIISHVNELHNLAEEKNLVEKQLNEQAKLLTIEIKNLKNEELELKHKIRKYEEEINLQKEEKLAYERKMQETIVQLQNLVEQNNREILLLRNENGMQKDLATTEIANLTEEKLSMEETIKNLNDLIIEKQQQIDSFKETIQKENQSIKKEASNYQQKITELETQLSIISKERSTFETQLQSLTTKSKIFENGVEKEKQELIRNLETKLSEYQEIIFSKSNVIQELTEKLNEQSFNLTELENQYISTTKELSNLKEQIQVEATKNKEFEKVLTEKNNQCVQNEARTKKLTAEMQELLTSKDQIEEELSRQKQLVLNYEQILRQKESILLEKYEEIKQFNNHINESAKEKGYTQSKLEDLQHKLENIILSSEALKKEYTTQLEEKNKIIQNLENKILEMEVELHGYKRIGMESNSDNQLILSLKKENIVLKEQNEEIKQTTDKMQQEIERLLEQLTSLSSIGSKIDETSLPPSTGSKLSVSVSSNKNNRRSSPMNSKSVSIIQTTSTNATHMLKTDDFKQLWKQLRNEIIRLKQKNVELAQQIMTVNKNKEDSIVRYEKQIQKLQSELNSLKSVNL
ncbi:hypothetical protein ABK040_016294 [Willaertia magna]